MSAWKAGRGGGREEGGGGREGENEEKEGVGEKKEDEKEDKGNLVGVLGVHGR